MTIKSIIRTHYLENCVIEGYKGYFSEWEIQVESGEAYGYILELCQKYLREEKFSKELFIKDLQFISKRAKNNSYGIPLNIVSFYDLSYNKDKNIWVYKVSRIKEKYFKY